MQVLIEARSFELTNSLRKYIQRKAKHAFRSRGKYIDRIVIQLSDINGPRGGVDKSCLLQVVIPSMTEVVVKDTKDCLYNAIDNAFGRARRTVDRKVTKRRSTLRQFTTSQMAHLANMSMTEDKESFVKAF